MATVIGVAATAALGLGLLLATVGIYGLLRMPEVFSQLHAAGLITGPAVVLVLLASVATGSAEIISSAVLVGAFVLITSPLSSHAIAEAAYREERPPAGDDDQERVGPP
jgi:multicomponent Na+:H+ antiporter subunit G